MRILILFFSLLFLQLGYSQLFSQNMMSYQALIFDGNNQLVKSKTVGAQLSILKDSKSGSPVYVERHQKNTDNNGFLKLEIGGGDVQSGIYDSIDWSVGPYYLKTEIDTEGGTDYGVTGVEQMLSVPFALHAKTVEIEHDPVFNNSVASNITAADTAKWNKTLVAGGNINISGDKISAIGGGPQLHNFYLGQDTLGGVVFHIYYDSLQQVHGLILGYGFNSGFDTINWLLYSYDTSTTNAISKLNGASNTILMENTTPYFVASLFNQYKHGGFSDWYIPASYELKSLWQNRFFVNQTLHKLGEEVLEHEFYWSSTEYDSDEAAAIDFVSGWIFRWPKEKKQKIPIIRAF